MTNVRVLIKRQPVAYIVFVPRSTRLSENPLDAERAVRILEHQAIEAEMLPYSEQPCFLHTPTSLLSKNEKAAREINLHAISNNKFDLLVLAGRGMSPYVREIIFKAGSAGLEIYVYADEDALIVRYLRMMQVGYTIK